MKLQRAASRSCHGQRISLSPEFLTAADLRPRSWAESFGRRQGPLAGPVRQALLLTGQRTPGRWPLADRSCLLLFNESLQTLSLLLALIPAGQGPDGGLIFRYPPAGSLIPWGVPVRSPVLAVRRQPGTASSRDSRSRHCRGALARRQPDIPAPRTASCRPGQAPEWCPPRARFPSR